MDKITKWLQEEFLTVNKKQFEGSEFCLLIPNLWKMRMPIEILKMKNESWLYATVRVQIEDVYKQKFDKLKGNQKGEFVYELLINILRYGVEYGFEPNQQELQNIRLSHVLYIEDMTRTSFMNSLRNLRNVVSYVTSMYAVKLNGKLDSS